MLSSCGSWSTGLLPAPACSGPENGQLAGSKWHVQPITPLPRPGLLGGTAEGQWPQGTAAPITQLPPCTVLRLAPGPSVPSRAPGPGQRPRQSRGGSCQGELQGDTTGQGGMAGAGDKGTALGEGVAQGLAKLQWGGEPPLLSWTPGPQELWFPTPVRTAVREKSQVPGNYQRP